MKESIIHLYTIREINTNTTNFLKIRVIRLQNKINKFILLISVVFILLVFIPSSFAFDNATDAVSAGSQNHYYFDASLENDNGNGSIETPMFGTYEIKATRPLAAIPASAGSITGRT